jgi:hypothetical protein
MLQISCDCGELLKSSFQVFDDLGGDDVGVGKIGAVFEAFVFKPELNPLGAENQTDKAARRSERERASQDVEVEFVALEWMFFVCCSVDRVANWSRFVD